MYTSSFNTTPHPRNPQRHPMPIILSVRLLFYTTKHGYPCPELPRRYSRLLTFHDACRDISVFPNQAPPVSPLVYQVNCFVQFECSRSLVSPLALLIVCLLEGPPSRILASRSLCSLLRFGIRCPTAITWVYLTTLPQLRTLLSASRSSLPPPEPYLQLPRPPGHPQSRHNY